MSAMLKTWIRRSFRLCGLEVKRIPAYEPYGWLKQKDIRTVLDIGANVGQFAVQIQRLLPDARLYSFEPLVGCYNQLVETMGCFPRFRAFNCAVGDRNGRAQIYCNDFTPSSSLLPMGPLHVEAFPFTERATPQEIEVRRLDDVTNGLDLVDNVLIKIDVQGMEDKVILGAEAVLSRASILIVETSFEVLYQGQALFDAVYDLLRERGFVYMGTEHIIRNPKDGRVLQCDSLFMRRTNCSE